MYYLYFVYCDRVTSDINQEKWNTIPDKSNHSELVIPKTSIRKNVIRAKRNIIIEMKSWLGCLVFVKVCKNVI